jgi:hypothetical protein
MIPPRVNFSNREYAGYIVELETRLRGGRDWHGAAVARIITV